MHDLCAPSSLDVFSEPSINVGIRDAFHDTIFPLSGVTNDSSIDFVLAGDPNSYVDLAASFLLLTVKVEKADGTALPTGSKIKLIECWPHALFRQIDVYLNQKLVSTSTNLYPYRAMLETLLGFRKSVKDEQINALEYYNGVAEVNIAKPKLEALIPLHVDIAHQNRCILSGVEIKLRLLRNQDDFLMITTDESAYQINIESITFWPKKIFPIESILMHHTQLLSEKNASYYTERAWIKAYSMTQGHNDEVFNNVFLGSLPEKVVAVFVNSKAFSGDKTLDPFKFSHYKVKRIYMTKNGQQIPRQVLETNFSEGLARRGYLNLLDTILGPCVGDFALGISYDEFINKGTGKHRSIFAFNLRSAPTGPRDALLPEETGNVSLHVQFAEPLTENVTLILYGDFSSKLEIDSNRNVYTNYG